MIDGPRPLWMRPIVLLSPQNVQARRLRLLGAYRGCELWFALGGGLERSFAQPGVMRDLDLRKVEGHAGDALRDAMRRGEAA